MITDAAEVQEIRNAIAEGRLLLRAGTKAGRTVDQLVAIRRQVERDMAKIGESRIAAAKIIDVTPAGYGCDAAHARCDESDQSSDPISCGNLAIAAA